MKRILETPALRDRARAALLVGLTLLALTVHAQPGAAASDAGKSASGPLPAVSNQVLGIGDMVRVTVYQNPDLSLEARINESGRLTYPLLGPVELAGLTVAAAERTIAGLLRDGRYVRSPQVNVLVTQLRSAQVSVLGQVNRPGRYPLEAQAQRMSELIAAAGGVVPGASDLVVLTGARDGQPVRRVLDLAGLLRGAGADADPQLQPGDTLFVDRAPVVYIYGEVQRPGAFRLERQMTLMQGLALGGGLTQRGTERRIRIHRRAADGTLATLSPELTDLLEADDVILVRESLF